MKLMRNTITIIIVMLLVTVMLCGNVNAATSIRASKSSVTVGSTVSITVSFGQKESSAQFRLNYDSSKFDYVSCSAGSFGTGTNTFVYVNYEDVADLGSVTLTFKSKEIGTGTFSISGVVLSSDNSSISTGSTSVKVEKAATTSSGSSSSTSKPSTNTSKKPTTSSSNSSNSNKNQNNTTVEETEPEVVVKLELNRIKQELEGKVETDYTEESWRTLQEAMVIAENATTNASYDEIKGKLSLDTLEKVTFETTELDKVLRDLIGKVQTDYTAESWNSLQEAINAADNAKLKSEYEAVKDKLTINTLILDERTYIEDLLNGPCEHGKIIISLAAVILVLLIIIIILLVLNRKVARMGRRTK